MPTMKSTGKKVYLRKSSIRRPRRKFKRLYRSLMLRPVFSFKRMTSIASIPASGVSSPYLWNENYVLSNVINYTEFTNLYDQYRINKVVTKIYMRRDPSAQTGATSDYPRLYYYRDYNDTSPPVSVNEVRENQKCRCVIVRPDRPITLVCVPNVSAMVYTPAVTNATTPKFKQWIESARSDATHFGFKGAIDFFTNANYILDFERTYYISCKAPK